MRTKEFWSPREKPNGPHLWPGYFPIHRLDKNAAEEHSSAAFPTEIYSWAA